MVKTQTPILNLNLNPNQLLCCLYAVFSFCRTESFKICLSMCFSSLISSLPLYPDSRCSETWKWLLWRYLKQSSFLLDRIEIINILWKSWAHHKIGSQLGHKCWFLVFWIGLCESFRLPFGIPLLTLRNKAYWLNISFTKVTSLKGYGSIHLSWAAGLAFPRRRAV